MTKRNPARALLRALLDALLPTRCAGCGRQDTPWCQTCAGALAAPFPVHRPHLPPTTAAAAYAGPARRLVIAAKERNRRDLYPVIAAALVSGVPPARPLTLVPVPSRPAASRRRGGPHMTAIAREVGGRVGLPVAEPLVLGRGARDSVGLGARERGRNLARHLRVRPEALPDTPVVLVDDVLTTGASAVACARALRGHGTKVAAVVVCVAA
ncbi:ComF family protein [Actinokineospora pegani]|uniref:ComF family protein n=1 Tax=Actinokineospora pegani TaxID=2654637 RepID=UPI0012EAF8C8|nr:ComF family protein [Actinokineospora pegani]